MYTAQIVREPAKAIYRLVIRDEKGTVISDGQTYCLELNARLGAEDWAWEHGVSLRYR